MPIKRNLYPPDWDEISKRIRFGRAQGKCEWCGVGHGATIMRSTVDTARYLVLHDDGCWYTSGGDLLRVSELPMEFDNSKIVKVCLTTHHVGVDKPDGTKGDRRDKMDCRDENLAALCERCHHLADLDLNIAARKVTLLKNKRKRILKTGQREFWSD